MKLLARILLLILGLLLLACGGAYVYIMRDVPEYQGERRLTGLQKPVEVRYDSYGIPHIYGETEEDLYMALGYTHASERLLQMEMIRRIADGRLSEMLGPDLVKTDLLFRTLGLGHKAETLAQEYLSVPEKPWQKAALAYVAGINAFIAEGKAPAEFALLGIEMEPFTPADMYKTAGYMAYGFAAAFKDDPLLTHLRDKLGPAYLNDIVTSHRPEENVIPVVSGNPQLAQVWQNGSGASFAGEIAAMMRQLPAPPLIGSNAWIIGPQKSASGKVIFANDPHIGFSQPAVWYEAHLESETFDFYGYHLAGFPFAPIGNSRTHAVGLTMLENDDMNFYVEKVNPENPAQVWANDHWENLTIREERMRIKGRADTVFQVRSSRHGPLINGVLAGLDKDSTALALWWVYLQNPGNLLEGAYQIGHSRSLGEIQQAAALIGAPGLNVMYADAAGNYAWFATAKLPKYPAHINPLFFMDGASGKDEILGYYDFSENPKSINPPVGYVYSANNQPDSMPYGFVPGYYLPKDRAQRIQSLLSADKKWSFEEMQQMTLDDVSPAKVALVQTLLPLLDDAAQTHPAAADALKALRDWKGDHSLTALAPTIYYKWQYHLIKNLAEDELGHAEYEVFRESFIVKRSLIYLFGNETSPWWDNRLTPEKETRQEIVQRSFTQALADLAQQLGPDVASWSWQRVHTIEHAHLFGRQPGPMQGAVNVGPFPVAGGDEVINNLAFDIDSSGLYKVLSGPSRRCVIDFADVEKGVSVLPTGQSGHRLSPHYDDQAQLFIQGKFRPQWLSRADVEANTKERMELRP